MPIELYTIDDDDETVEEVIAMLRYSLSMAQEAEIMRPETVSALRKWCNVEWRRINTPLDVVTVSPEQEMRAALSRSPWREFWESLTKDQEVRWTGTKSATYFVVDPNPVTKTPEDRPRTGGLYIELRRHTGKTFWTHIGQVRPMDYDNEDLR